VSTKPSRAIDNKKSKITLIALASIIFEQEKAPNRHGREKKQQKEFFFAEKFGGSQKSEYLCTRKTERHRLFFEILQSKLRK